MFSGAHLNVNGWESRVKLKSIFSISPFSTSRRRNAAVLGIRIGSALQIHFLHHFFGFVDFVGFCVSAIRKAMHIGTELILCYFWISFWFAWPISWLLWKKGIRKAPHCTSAPTTHLLSLGLSVLPRDFSFVSFCSIVAYWTSCFELWSAPVSCPTVAAFCNCPGIACGSRFQRPKVQPEKRLQAFVQGFRLATVLL